MVRFELGKETQKDVSFVLSRAWDTGEKFRVPMRNHTSDLQIPCSDALPISQRDSVVSKVHYKVQT